MSNFGQMFGDYRTKDPLTTILGWLDDAGIQAPGGIEGKLEVQVRTLITKAMKLQDAGKINEARRVALEAFKVAHDGWLHF